MKKNLLLLGFVLLATAAFSQEITQEYINISEKCGSEMATNFQKIEGQLKDLAGKDTIKILFLPVLNSTGQYTKITDNISPRLANILQQKLKGQFSRFNLIIVEFSKNKNPQCDFYLESNYSLTSSEFVVENIILQKSDNQKQVAVASSSYLLSVDISSDEVVMEKQFYFIESVENNFQTKTNFIYDEIKFNLIKNNYTVENESLKANYIIKINSNVTEDKKVYGIYFTIIKATIQVTEISTNKSVYFNSYEQKGGSNNSFQESANNGYKEVAKLISNDFLNFLAKK